MRILWLSNAPWSSSGYGTQTRATVPQLQRLGHDLAICAYYGLQGGMLHWQDTPVYPGLRQRYGQDAVAPHAHHFKADLVISLMDAWVCEPDYFPEQRWVPWFPIDSDPIPECVTRKVARSFYPITMSPFGARQCEAIGLEAGYVPHAIDTDAFAPIERTIAREQMGMPQDRYIVGMVAANVGNPSRKAFPQQLAGFKLFQQTHPDALLYLHTRDGVADHDAVNLVELCEHLGLHIGRDVVFADAYAYRLGFPDPQMALLYNGMDVLLSVSMGEGFGIPILEAQACGTPVIVGDWTAMGDLAFPGSLTIPQTEALAFYTALASYQWLARPEAIAQALAHSYAHTPDRAPLRQAALAFDAATVRETHWRPVLAEVERRIQERGRL